LAPSRIKCFPTSVEPVNVIIRTALLESIASPISLEFPVTRLTTPFGMPARSNILTTSIADSGVTVAGFKTTVQPAAKAGPTFRVIIEVGKFQGVIAPTTPTGLGTTSILFEFVEDGIHSPYARLASSAYQSMDCAAPKTSPFASASGLPCSVVK